MKDYTKMSDLKINKAVANSHDYLKLDSVSLKKPKVRCVTSTNIHEDGLNFKLFDWCNDHEDWASLLVDNNISLSWLEVSKLWGAGAYDEESAWQYGIHKKPGRAVAICFLMMQEAENEKSTL